MKTYIFFPLLSLIFCCTGFADIYADKLVLSSDINEVVAADIALSGDIETISVKYNDFLTSPYAARPELVFAYNVATALLDGDEDLFESYLLEDVSAHLWVYLYRDMFFALAEEHLDDLRIKYYMSQGMYFTVTFTLDSFIGCYGTNNLFTYVFLNKDNTYHLSIRYYSVLSVVSLGTALPAALHAQTPQATVPGQYQHMLNVTLPKPGGGSDSIKLYFNGSQPTWGREVIVNQAYVPATPDPAYPLNDVLNFYRDTMLIFSKVNTEAITLTSPEILALKSRIAKESWDELTNFIQDYNHQAISYVQYKTDGIVLHYIVDADPIYVFVTSRESSEPDKFIFDFVEKDGDGYKMTYQLIQNPFMRFLNAPEVKQAFAEFLGAGL